jgi:hypothetical protein
VNGFIQADPDLQWLADKYLSTAGKAVLKDLSTMCVGDAIFGYAYKRSTSWTTGGQSLSDIIAAEPSLRSFIDEQYIGDRKPTGVVRVATGVADNLVPHGQARTMAVDWCRLGGQVVYAPILLPSVIDPLLNHFGPLLADQGTAVSWLADRLAGKSAASNCAFMPILP